MENFWVNRAKRILSALWLLGTIVLTGRGESLTNRFAFTGPEIFPIDHQSGHLRAADLDGDGLQDLIIVNNFRSKINLLYNRTGQTNQAEVKAAGKRELNELPPDARFRIDSIASEKRISSLVVADLNGDGRPDIAYYGEPKELVLQFNQGTNGWSGPKRWPVDDGLLDANALASGDLNGDGRTDLLLLGENYVYLLVQTTNHTLAEPEKIPDRKSTRLNSSHSQISYAVFCLKKKSDTRSNPAAEGVTETGAAELCRVRAQSDCAGTTLLDKRIRLARASLHRVIKQAQPNGSL